MKLRFIVCTAFLLFLFYNNLSRAQEDLNITAVDSDAVGLNLYAVGELFKDSENLEEFEKAINDPDKGINNLDLDNDGEVDYIRVVEEAAENNHLIILQVPMAKDEFQDVATIEVEKSGDDYNLQIEGNKEIYGNTYYIVPTEVHIRTWPLIAFIYRPGYHLYRSAFYFGFYPHWWHPFHPIAHHVYHTRAIAFAHRGTFTFTKTTRFKTVARVHYKPHSSKHVVKKTTVIHHGRTKTVKRTRVKVR